MSYRFRVVLRCLIICTLALPLFADSDISVLKDGPSTFAAGSDVTYTITVTNGGPDDTLATTTLADNIPAGMSFVSFTQNSGPTFNCTTGQTISCNIASLTNGAVATFSLVVNVAPDAAPGTFFTNIATVSNPEDPDDENNSSASTGSTPQPPSADLLIGKTGPSGAAANTDVSFTINVGNAGPNTAVNVTTTDTLPGTMTFVSLSPVAGFACTTPAVGSGGTITCTNPSFAASSNVTFTLTTHIPPGTAAGTTFQNIANISSDTADPSPENNSGNSTVIVVSSDAGVTKTATPSAQAGSNVTYTITATNNGPDIAETLTMSDTLPAGTTFVSLTQDTGPTANCNAPLPGSTGPVQCSMSTVPSGMSAQFTLVVHVNSNFSSPTLSNTATVSTTSGDTNPLNNSATANTTITTAADLSVVKSAPSTANAGSTFTYTITAANTGPSDAQNVSLTDTIPAGTNFVSINQTSGPTFNCIPGGTTTCTIATLASGASATFNLSIAPATSTAAGMVLSNTANISSTTTDSNPINNSSTATTTITTSADLVITKTAPGATLPNSDLTYTITTNNNGPSDALTVTVSDTLPANTTFVSINPSIYSCTTPAVGSTGAVVCTRASIAAITTQVITLVVHTSSSLAGTISNTATISSATTDPNPANNTSTAVSSSNATDLAITKASAAPPAINQIAFSVTVTNNGPNPATTVTMTDAVPAGTTFVSESQTAGPAFLCTNPAVGGTGTVSCTIASLAASTSATFKLVFQPTAISSSPISNTASVTSATVDTNPANNSATASAVPPSAIPAASPITLVLLALTLSMIAVMILRR